MRSNTVFRITCVADDPLVPARVIGVFASRWLLPQRFTSWLSDAGIVEMEVELHLREGEGTGPCHLARVLQRLPVVLSVELLVNGCVTAHELGS